MTPSYDLDKQAPELRERVIQQVTKAEFVSNIQTNETLQSMMQAIGISTTVTTGFNIDSIDKQDEHTPTNEEYSALRTNILFKRIVKQIGGLRSVRRVKCGTQGMIMNRIHVDDTLENTNKYARIAGWCILVGAPTGILFLPFFWLEHKETGQWKSVSGFTDESSMILATSKLEGFKSIGSHVFKSVAMFPVADTQQTIESFQKNGVFGSTSLCSVYAEVNGEPTEIME